MKKILVFILTLLSIFCFISCKDTRNALIPTQGLLRFVAHPVYYEVEESEGNEQDGSTGDGPAVPGPLFLLEGFGPLGGHGFQRIVKGVLHGDRSFL